MTQKTMLVYVVVWRFSTHPPTV